MERTQHMKNIYRIKRGENKLKWLKVMKRGKERERGTGEKKSKKKTKILHANKR